MTYCHRGDDVTRRALTPSDGPTLGLDASEDGADGFDAQADVVTASERVLEEALPRLHHRPANTPTLQL